MNFRSTRVGKLIREELGKIIVRELEFPNALVTLTEVEIDKKLEHALVNVSVIPSSAAEKTLEKLKKSRGKLQHFLNNKLNIKPMPRIEFKIDRGPENAANVEKRLLESQ
ncbi:MAG: 30S ribosome-binding factor RbfA [Candidatus Liptonbacteria bacterium]|nr:30S ribosome-binding factor RbfA [Candidatus Liptonbacteria bacterium]